MQIVERLSTSPHICLPTIWNVERRRIDAGRDLGRPPGPYRSLMAQRVAFSVVLFCRKTPRVYYWFTRTNLPRACDRWKNLGFVGDRDVRIYKSP